MVCKALCPIHHVPSLLQRAIAAAEAWRGYGASCRLARPARRSAQCVEIGQKADHSRPCRVIGQARIGHQRARGEAVGIDQERVQGFTIPGAALCPQRVRLAVKAGAGDPVSEDPREVGRKFVAAGYKRVAFSALLDHRG